MELQAFIEFDGVNVRFDEDTMRVSVYDVCQVVTGQIPSHARQSVNRLFKQWSEFHPENEVDTKCVYLKFPGKGQKPTPVADAAVMIELIWLMPGRKAKEFRSRSAKDICRILGGDESLIEEIRHRQETTDPASREFFLHPTKQRLSYEQQRGLARKGAKRKAELISQREPNANPGTYRKAFGQMNMAVMGINKRELKRRAEIKKKMQSFVARDYMYGEQLAMISTGEAAENGIRIEDTPNQEPEIKDVLSMISKLSDYAGLKGRFLPAPAKTALLKSEK